jgi:hypothetical protein
LALHLVANQSTRTQAQTTAYRRPSARMANCGANEPARNGAANSTDPGALLTGREWATRATSNHECATQQKHPCFVRKGLSHIQFSLFLFYLC